MLESVLVPGKGRIRASIEKLSRREYQKRVESVTVLKNGINPGEYREKVDPVRVWKNCPDEYRKRVESVCVPKNGRIRASSGKR